MAFILWFQLSLKLGSFLLLKKIIERLSCAKQFSKALHVLNDAIFLKVPGDSFYFCPHEPRKEKLNWLTRDGTTKKGWSQNKNPWYTISITVVRCHPLFTLVHKLVSLDFYHLQS